MYWDEITEETLIEIVKKSGPTYLVDTISLFNAVNNSTVLPRLLMDSRVRMILSNSAGNLEQRSTTMGEILVNLFVWGIKVGYDIYAIEPKKGSKRVLKFPKSKSKRKSRVATKARNRPAKKKA